MKKFIEKNNKFVKKNLSNASKKFFKNSLKKITYRTACPREVATRGGHPLGLIEYVVERVYQVFLPFELHKFGIVVKWPTHR